MDFIAIPKKVDEIDVEYVDSIINAFNEKILKRPDAGVWGLNTDFEVSVVYRDLNGAEIEYIREKAFQMNYEFYVTGDNYNTKSYYIKPLK